ncbi:5-formyltetrahydrofolate cyclo-ligase-like isoform X2 [Patiria miniata]|uniref:5-formyltetrahydrofolate cyclo-ligase n=1 Tax=Patiria miniata TaxID=46514 RepID=A0A914BAF4_PATMI|nr:5-formyltetrahydrofolate cyclo-ligase-like isoform X2 [Patiria miniata]
MAAAMREAKSLLRREMKQRIAALSSEEKVQQSAIIFKKLTSHPVYQSSQRISVYLSTADEVNTQGILEHMFANNKKAYVPQYIGPRMDMLRLYSMEDYDTLPLTKWNIKQPGEGDQREEALATGLDLIIVPGLAFTTGGDRLGKGKGYYDKYQERCAKHPGGKPKTIALAFKEQMCATVPVSESDVTIDYVIHGDAD